MRNFEMKNKVFKTENLTIESFSNGAVDKVYINGKLFNGFPGKLCSSPGTEVSACWQEKGNYLACTISLVRTSGIPENGAFVNFRVPYQEM
jgi:hypothetical protein